MYYDVVLMKKSADAEVLGKKLGFGKIVFLDESKNLRIVDGKDEMINRKAVEDGKTQILLNPQQGQGRDKMHYRTSGLNQVLCALAHENNVAVAFTLDKVQDPVQMGKVMQNVMLCRKYKMRMLFFSHAKALYEMRSASDMMSFCRMLGMTPGEAQQALTGLGILERKL